MRRRAQAPRSPGALRAPLGGVVIAALACVSPGGLSAQAPVDPAVASTFALDFNALIASGLVLWTVSRRRKLANPATPYFGFRRVEVMNVGAVLGLPLALAGFFWADRLLPAGLAARPAVEGRIFLAAIAATIVYSALRPQKRAWTETAWLAACAFAAIPLLSAATGGRNLAASLASQPSQCWMPPLLASSPAAAAVSTRL